MLIAYCYRNMLKKRYTLLDNKPPQTQSQLVPPEKRGGDKTHPWLYTMIVGFPKAFEM